MKKILKKLAAETIGTFIFLTVALGSVAQMVLGGGNNFKI